MLSPAEVWNVLARKLLGRSEEWTWVRLEALNDEQCLVTGGVPRKLKSGPNKGKITWRDAILESCVIRFADARALRAVK